MVLCAFNQTYKLGAETFALWCELLAAAPGAVLWVLAFHPLAADNLRREMAARGVDPARLIAAPHLPLDRHLSRMACADLFVDTYPCNAHTTASDALWAGVPVLTRLGQAFASRVAASLLRSAGLPELVTQSCDEYREKLLGLVRAPTTLARYKERLAATRNELPLFDSVRYTRDLERAFRAIWDRHRRGLPPDHIVIGREA